MEIQEKISTIKEKYPDTHILRFIADEYEKGERPIVVSREEFTGYFKWMRVFSSPEPSGLTFMDTYVIKK